MMENLTVSQTYTAHNTDTSTHIWKKKKSTSKSTMDIKYAIFPAANDILPFMICRKETQVSYDLSFCRV